MKSFFKKSIFTIISLQLILSNGLFNVDATENTIQTISNDFSALRFIGFQDVGTDSVQYGSVSTQSDSNSYPTKYDMREVGLVSGTEAQGGYGLCWAFATTQSAISKIIEREAYIDLSEWHLGYFTYNGDTPMEMYDSASPNSKFYSKGGSASFATATLSRWDGFVSDEVVPYDSGDVDSSLNHVSEYHLTDAICMRSALNDNITYNDYNDTIKEMILDGNSIMISIYYNALKYYSSDSNSYYCSDDTHNVNHGVTIVGWDDDFYSYDGLDDKPTSKGAWLIKNTYGYQFGDYGYFWLSYENLLSSDVTSFIVDSSENYSTNYTIDDYGWTTSIDSLTNEKNNKYTDYAGNVFTAVNDEDLSAVGIYTTDYNTEYKVYIYKNLTDDTSPIGELVQSFSGTQKYSGFHTIPLETPVSLETGERFSVVVKYKNPNYTNTVAVESAVKFFTVSDGEIDVTQYNLSEENLLATTLSNESFVSNDGKTWKSIRGTQGIITTSDVDFNYRTTIDTTALSDGYYAISTLGNACIKAFTNPHNKVYFSQYGGNLYADETIELSTPVTDATIYYTTDGSTPTLDSNLYTEPIVFTGQDLTISARVCVDGVLGETYTETFSQLNSTLSTLCIKETIDDKDYFTEMDVFNDTEANTTLQYTCDTDATTLRLFPISCGNVTIDGEQVTSGHEMEVTIDDSDTTIIPITVSKEGCMPTEYTLTIDRKVNVPVEIDYNYVDILLLKKYLLDAPDSYNDVLIYNLNGDDVVNLADLILLKEKVMGR